MRILFLGGNLKEVGGIQRYNRFLLKALSGNEISVLELRKSDFLDKIIFILRFLFVISTRSYDLLICSHINFVILGYTASKLRKLKYVVICHGIEVWDIKNAKTKKFMSAASKIIAVSSYTADKLTDQMPGTQSKIFILSNTVDDSKFKIGPKPKKLLETLRLQGAKIILTVARLAASEKYKGYDKVIEALPMILKSVPEAKYVLVGSGDDTERIKSLIGKMGLEDKVVMTGYIGEVELPLYYNFCDVFVMPSKGEGFGIVFLEALASGKPVVAGDQDGSRDAILNGELGILVDPDNTTQIAEAVITVLKGKAPKKLYNPEYLRGMVIEAYGFASFESKVKNFLASYELSR